jgi:uncharacterized membrane protein/mono/diheme cytochrome c family protein
VIEWLHVFGRLHPLVLHLPIGLLAGLAAVEVVAIVRGRPAPREVTAVLAWLAAASGVLAAATGLVLSRESGYAGDTLTKHLYLGITLAVVCVVMGAVHGRERRGPFRAALLAALAVLLPTGHLGGTMTHGEGFLTSPLMARRAPAPVAPEPAGDASPVDVVFAATVAPILESRCTGCHGDSRRKGDLALNSPQAIAAGGKHGPVIDATDPASSELLRRIRLPLSDDAHMPPKGKPQLTIEQREALERWIAAGAPLDARPAAPGTVVADASTQRGRASATDRAAAPAGPAPAPEAALAALRARQVHVEPVECSSTLLWIDFAAAAPTFTDDDVRTLLTPVRDQAAEVSLARSAITDRGLADLATMPNLRRLDLRGTKVSSAGVALLRAAPSLEQLVLAQTSLSDAVVAELDAMAALKRVNLWRSGVSLDAVKHLTTRRAALVVETGGAAPGTPVQTEESISLTSGAPLPSTTSGTPPGTTSGTLITPVNAVCPVSGKPVDPEYVIVYRGRVIGLCCRLCAAQFWADPAKFEAALAGK